MEPQALTEAEYDEMIKHPMYPDSIEEIVEDTAWHQRVLDNTPDNDPVHNRFRKNIEGNNRIVHLKERFAKYGKEANV